ncbi:dUTP diphosphatase [Blautia massiliensis (ex Liu et al. 2021)]|uniref:dUTP diphosphatase n=1 Tax=Blautia massiliensis (ex Liu et al. 2021) TaxID=3062492 RepID=UPI003F8B6AF7
MKIKLIDFGLTPGHNPLRVHENDAGADVYMPYDCTLQPGEIVKVPLGFGLILPDGYAGFVFPRSSMAEKGLTCELPPIDSRYRGEIHAIIMSIPVQFEPAVRSLRATIPEAQSHRYCHQKHYSTVLLT